MAEPIFIADGLLPRPQRIQNSLLALFQRRALESGVVPPIDGQQSETWLRWVIPEIELAYNAQVFSPQKERLERALEEVKRIFRRLGTDPTATIRNILAVPMPVAQPGMPQTTTTTQNIFVPDGPRTRGRTIQDNLLTLFGGEANAAGVDPPIGDSGVETWLRWIVPEIEGAYDVHIFALEDLQLTRALAAIQSTFDIFGESPAKTIEYIHTGIMPGGETQ